MIKKSVVYHRSHLQAVAAVLPRLVRESADISIGALREALERQRVCGNRMRHELKCVSHNETPPIAEGYVP